MIKATTYICEICFHKYGTSKEALDCEKSHRPSSIEEQKKILNYKKLDPLPKMCLTCKFFYRNEIDIPMCDYLTSNVKEYMQDEDLIVHDYACCDKYEQQEDLS